MRGMIVVLEGLDGTGKTTLQAFLGRELGAAQLATPPKWCRPIRKRLDPRLSMHPRLSRWVYSLSVMAVGWVAWCLAFRRPLIVIDRYWLSTLTTAEARNLSGEPWGIRWLIPRADMTLLLRINETVRRERLGQRGTDAWDEVTLRSEVRSRVEEAYRRLQTHPVAGRVVELDVSDLALADVAQQLRELVVEMSRRR